MEEDDPDDVPCDAQTRPRVSERKYQHRSVRSSSTTKRSTMLPCNKPHLILQEASERTFHPFNRLPTELRDQYGN
jgi:hypothetical protein